MAPLCIEEHSAGGQAVQAEGGKLAGVRVCSWWQQEGSRAKILGDFLRNMATCLRRSSQPGLPAPGSTSGRRLIRTPNPDPCTMASSRVTAARQAEGVQIS